MLRVKSDVKFFSLKNETARQIFNQTKLQIFVLTKVEIWQFYIFDDENICYKWHILQLDYPNLLAVLIIYIVKISFWDVLNPDSNKV